MSKAQKLANRLNKELGTKAIRLANDPDLQTQYLPTGVAPIDELLQGGLPRNRTVEFFGAWSVLKSFIALKALATTQANGGVGALLDTEHSFDPDWAWDLGVDLDELLYITPESGEEAVDITESLVREQTDLIVWDSVAATLPVGERDKREVGENANVAELARLMSRAMRKLTTANSRTALCFINQTREKVGRVFGNPETTPGGRALPFYASMRVALRPAGKERREVDGEKEVYAFKITAKLVKSKVNKPFRDITFTFSLDEGGVDNTRYHLDKLIADGTIGYSNGWYRLPDHDKGVREEEAREWVRSHSASPTGPSEAPKSEDD